MIRDLGSSVAASGQSRLEDVEIEDDHKATDLHQINLYVKLTATTHIANSF